jgi:hypothetical protein
LIFIYYRLLPELIPPPPQDKFSASGIVTKDGEGVPNCDISLLNDTGVEIMGPIKTGEGGSYLFEGLINGNYEAKAIMGDAVGSAPIIIQGQNVVVNVVIQKGLVWKKLTKIKIISAGEKPDPVLDYFNTYTYLHLFWH